MKIRHRILILIALPIVSQLVTVGLLIYSLARVDSHAEQEVVAKRIVAYTEDMTGAIGRQMLTMAKSNLYAKQASTTTERAKILRDTKELKALLKDNPEMLKVVNRVEVTCMRLFDQGDELSEAVRFDRQKIYLADFLNNQELLQSMEVNYDLAEQDIRLIAGKYVPIAREFQPEALAERAFLRVFILIAVIVAVLVIVVTMVILHRSTLNRLQILINNIRNFSKGEKSLEILSGEDELGELDRAFREMSDERNRLDDIRRAMRSMVNHDIRSPLTAINLRLDLMIAKYESSLEPEVLVQIKRVYSEAQRLMRLSSTLLDVEKLEEGKVEIEKQIVSAQSIVAVSASSIEAMAEHKTITINNDIPKDLFILCDFDRTVQVFVNFLANALKYSPVNSSVDIKAEQTHNGTVKFSIFDRGPGVPEHIAGRLFSKFQQLRQPVEIKQEGSGLGLYICKMLVEAQGGSVGYSSREGGGSCFWFEIPEAGES